MPKIDLWMSSNCPLYTLSVFALSRHTSAMEKMIEWLVSIGWKEAEIAYIKAHYDDAETQDYLSYLRAVFDDRREYAAE